MKKTKHKKDPHAVALGRKGGKAPKTKPAGFATMDKERLREISIRGNQSRKRKKSD